MNLLSGMDIAHIRLLAQQMIRGATDLRGLINDLTTDVENVPWRGPDREAFLDQWNGSHLVRLKRVAEGLETAGHDANVHARRQEEASAR